MKKLTKKITTIAGAATLAVGLMALPALADTSQQQRGGWIGQMQKAMRDGDFSKMQELMNSDSALKAQMGQENLNKMNEFMSNHGGGMM